MRTDARLPVFSPPRLRAYVKKSSPGRPGKVAMRVARRERSRLLGMAVEARRQGKLADASMLMKQRDAIDIAGVRRPDADALKARVFAS